MKLRRDGSNAFDVRVRIAADFQLEAAIAVSSVAGDFARHDFGSFLRDRSVQAEIVAVATAEQHAHRLPRHFAENVPAGHVDGRLHIRMPLQRGIHATIEFAQLRRVFTEEMRANFHDARPCSRRIRRQIERTKRTDLAVAGDADVSLDRDNRAVEH